MLSSLIKEHQTKQAAKRVVQEQKRKECIAAANDLTQALVDHLNVGSLNPRENLAVWMFCVEGFHNFHHTFPWDYRATELPFYNMLTPTVLFIEAMAKIGQAYDLKSVSPEIVKQRAQRTGDGSHHLWGWDDPEFTEKLKEKFGVVSNPERGEKLKSG